MYIPETIVFVACLFPYYLLNRPLPTFGNHWFDNLWIARNTHRIVHEPLAIFTVYKDPWFRYVPQSIVMWLGELFVEIPRQAHIYYNAQYTILIAGVATPLCLYLLARTLLSRRVALASVLGLALIQFRLYPWYPGIPLVIEQFLANGNTAGAVEVFGRSWYRSQHWQYAWPIPFALAALLFSSNQGEQQFERASIYAGICLGLVASMQVIQASIVALIIAISNTLRDEYRKTAVIAVISFIVQSPNLIIIAQNLDVWISMGVGRMQLSAVSTHAPLLILLLVTVGGSGYLIYRFAPKLGDRWSILNEKPLLIVWPAATGFLFVVSAWTGAWWYRWHTATLFRFAGCLFFGIIIVDIYTPLMRQYVEQR